MKPILAVLHQAQSSTGRVGHMLAERGFTLDLRRPCIGEPLPDTLAEHSGAVVFGGPMSANDCDDYVLRELEWMAVPLKEEKPLFGICLGAQILARALGAGVDHHPQGLVEVGYYPLKPTAAGTEILEWPDHVYQWHREGFELPRTATLLAEGETFPNQAFRYGRAAFGVQFHPEVTHQMLCRWTTRGHERLTLPGAQSRTEHFDGRMRHDAGIRRWLAAFLDLWVGLIPSEDSRKMQGSSQNATHAPAAVR